MPPLGIFGKINEGVRKGALVFAPEGLPNKKQLAAMGASTLFGLGAGAVIANRVEARERANAVRKMPPTQQLSTQFNNPYSNTNLPDNSE